MGFKRVKFSNFRNIESREIKLSGGLNLLTGLNGSGKTNFLEGINILSGWGTIESPTKIYDLFNKKTDIKRCVITGEFEEFNEIVQAKIDKRIALRLNDNTVSSTEMRSKHPVLCFLPNDTQIVEGNSSRRRRILDMVLALIVPAYAKRINDYRQAIRQKNAMLASGKSTEVIERIILPLAAWIWKMRKEAVQLIFEELIKIEDIVPYSTEIVFSCGGGTIVQEENENYKIAVKMLAEKERKFGIAFVGPHRDDIEIKFEEGKAAEKLSRGYRRRIAIGIMLAAGNSVYRKTGIRPIFLLDEVTAELDAQARELLFATLLREKAQIFAATAEPFIDKFNGAVYEVNNGVVIRKE